MEIVDVLKQIGLNEKQASVYLALLELGTADVSDIAKKAGIKRPTCYLVLDELKKQGLAFQVPAKVNLFVAESPQKLAGELYKKQELLKRFLPNLEAMHNVKVEKPQIQLFEGREGVLEVYKKVLSSPSVDFFCNIGDVMGAFEDLPNDLKNLALAKKIKVRELLTQGTEDLIHAGKMPQHEYYENRFVPKNRQFLTDNVFFQDSVAFFSYSPYLFSVVITSKGVVTSLKTIFEMAWASAETYDKVMNDSGKRGLV